MNIFDELYARLKDFDITKERIEECVSTISKERNIPSEEVYEMVLESIREQERRCINKAAEHNMKLEQYQEKAVKHMLTHRGLIVAFDVGTGKTLTAVTITSCVLNAARIAGKNITVVVITPTSLQENFRKEMKAYGANPDDPRYQFYTTTGFANAYKRGEIDCKNTFLVVDEAHNLRTDYRMEFSEISFGKGDKENTRAELVIKCARSSWKVLLLTATPVYDYEHHIVNLAAMVLGREPFTAGEFAAILANEKIFKSTFGCMFAFYKSDKVGYPERIDRIVDIVMTPEYYEKYERIQKSISLTKKQREELNQKGTSNTLMVRTRMMTLTLEPTLKINYTVAKIKEGKKTLVYSDFLEPMDLLKKRLDNEKIPYLQISGSISKKQRAEIVRKFNDLNGGVNVLIISKAGGEGLDLKGVRYIILMEKGWTVAGEDQITGRGIRKKSHAHLPPQDQNVTVYHLIMKFPKDVIEKAIQAGNNRRQRNRRWGVGDAEEEQPSRGDPFLDKIRDLPKEALTADEYLYAHSRRKAFQTEELKKRLEAIDIFHNPDGCEKELEPIPPFSGVIEEDVEIANVPTSGSIRKEALKYGINIYDTNGNLRSILDLKKSIEDMQNLIAIAEAIGGISVYTADGKYKKYDDLEREVLGY